MIDFFLRKSARFFAFVRDCFIFRKVNCRLRKIYIGTDVGGGFCFSHPENLFIGDFTSINGNCHVNALGGVKIGKYCHIGRGLTIFSHNHNWRSDKAIPYDDKEILKPVEIGDAVWIGANVTIAPGVRIGRGAIIAIGSVVFNEVPECAIVRGNPAVVIGYRDREVFSELYAKGKME